MDELLVGYFFLSSRLVLILWSALECLNWNVLYHIQLFLFDLY